ncbi:MAG: hypothetical protein ABFS19_08430 [Thermodesulfobacteriota bacterium]
MKRSILIMIAVSVMLLSGCKSQYIGQTVRQPAHTLAAVTGHQVVTMKHIVLDYDYSIKGDKIYFDGTIGCGPKLAKTWDDLDIDLEILFIDSNQKVVKSERFSPVSGDNFCENQNLFVASYPYLDSYKSLTFTYSMSMIAH